MVLRAGVGGNPLRNTLIALALVFGLMNSAGAEWREAVSPGFVVYSQSRPETVVEFVRKVERFDTFLRRRAAIADRPASVRLTIFLVNGQVGALMGDPGATSARGFFEYGPNGPMAVVERADGRGRFAIDADTILFHEYTHHFMHQYFPGAYPPWFVEGFAEFYSTIDFDDEGRATYGNPALHRVNDLYNGPKWPVERLLNSDTSGLDAEAASSFYGRAWLLTHFLTFASDRAGQLDRYIKLINEGADPMDSAVRAFGDLNVLESDLNEYLKKRKLVARRELEATPVTANIDVLTLAPDDAALVFDRLQIMTRPEAKQLESVIADLEAMRTKFPNSAAAAALLAEARYLKQDYEAARASAAAAVAIKPGDALALLYGGRAEAKLLAAENVQDEEKWKLARSWIVRANRIEPENPYPLYAYYMSFLEQGVAPRQIARDGLAKAFTIAPTDPEIRMAMIQLLISENELEAAVQLLKPIAYQPHGGEAANWARALMTQLEFAIKNGRRFDDSPLIAPKNWTTPPSTPHGAPPTAPN